MKRGSGNRGMEGSITVFLSLVLLLILALLFTIIEGARISSAKIFAGRALTTAMDSVLAEFYGPLWNEYHVFGLDAGYGSDQVQEGEIAERLQNYMSYTFNPNQEINEPYYKDRLELYNISVEDISVEDQTMLTDYQGKLFINEAVEYMKYKELGNGIELLLDKMSLLESPQKVTILYEKKQRVEEELVEIDEGILELMELLDGVKTSKKGISLNKEGTLKITSYFVKKINLGAITKEGVGINQESIFLALKDSYVNPMVTFEEIENNFQRIKESSLRINEIDTTYNDTTATLIETNETLMELNSVEEKTKMIKTQIIEIKAVIEELGSKLEGLQKERDGKVAEQQQCSAAILQKKKELSLLIDGILPKIESAKTAIDRIYEKTAIAEPLIKEYEKSLYEGQNEISENIFEGMEEGLNELKRYTSSGEGSYNFAGMKQILESNLNLLSQTERQLEQGEQEFLLNDYMNSEISFINAGNLLSSYQIAGLTLDYSSMVLNKAEALNPLGMIGSIIQEGITGLVIDSATISKAQLTEERLPSVIAAMAMGKGSFLDNLTSFFEDAAIGDRNSGMGNLFGSFRFDTQALSQMGGAVNAAAEQFLFQEYQQEHFYSFPMQGEDVTARKPSVLTYELEYLLVGDTTDKENLSSVISRIIFVRTILDFVSLLGDKEKCGEAQLAAASLVGFTGLPILVSITKTMILLVWSFAESLVDTGALLMGKELPILKKNIALTFPELFTLNHSFIEQKASGIVKTEELSLSYLEYLRIFLFIKNKEDLAYRSMDLMQENIRIRYDDSFTIQNCLFGYKIEAKFNIPSKFMGFAFMQKYLQKSVKGFHFESTATYSY